MQIEALPWDSKFFELEVASIELNDQNSIEQVEQLLTDSDYDLVYLKSTVDIPEWESKMLGAGNIHLIDNKLVFGKVISSSKVMLESSDVKIYIEAITENSKELTELALRSGTYSRFKRDEKLSPKFEAMYRTWIQKSLDKEYGELVLAAVVGGRIVGFVSLGTEDSKAIIHLIAVSSEDSGKGIGKALLNACEDYCLKNSKTHLEVSTQAINQSAVSFYQKNKFELLNSSYIYHYWKVN